MELVMKSVSSKEIFLSLLRQHRETFASRRRERYKIYVWQNMIFPAMEREIEAIMSDATRRTSTGIVELFRTFVEMGYKLEDILAMESISPVMLDYFLNCFSMERFPTHYLRRSTLLMDDIRLRKGKSLVLIKNGFSYFHDHHHFVSCCIRISYCTRIIGIEKIYREINLERLIKQSYRRKLNLRMQLLLELLLTIYNQNDQETMKDIYRMLWKSVPYPFISTTEIYTLLKPYCFGDSENVRSLCDDFAKRNDVCDVPEVSQPRSLLHLSRVQVRKNLCIADQLTDDVIDCMKIPGLIKKYLKLDIEL